MDLFQFTNEWLKRRHQIKLIKLRRARQIDARGWVGIGIYCLTLVDMAMLALSSDLRGDEFFKAVSMLIIGTGFINGVVSWAYSATKTGGDLANNNAELVRKQAEASPPIEEANKKGTTNA